MELTQLIDMLLHIDKSLGHVIATYGTLVYLVLFAVVFAETGLVVFPFLPGDTLLFVGGAFCANGAMNVWLLGCLLVIAGVTGNTVNYMIGRAIGHKVYTHNYRWLDRESLQKTHRFFEKHGGKTIVLARWLPIVRTFAPFVAGVSEMHFAKFQIYNVSGAVFWVAVLVSAGYFFGNIPLIRDHLNTIVMIGVSAAVVPLALAGLWRLGRKLFAGKAKAG